MRLEITWKTILKVLAGVLLAVVARRIWPLCELLIVAILLAIPLYRVVLWAEHRHWPRGVGILLASSILVTVVLGFFAVLGPMAVSEGKKFSKDVPKFKEEALAKLPPKSPYRDLLNKAGDFGSGGDLEKLLGTAALAGRAIAEGALDLVLLIAVAIYLLVDGPRMLRWLLAFFPRAQRRRVAKGLEEIRERVVAYIVGQAIVSGLFAAYVMILLSILRVPMAILLAIVAGFLDVIPVLGIAIFFVLGTLVAFTVSSTTGIIVGAGCLAYHVLEDYFILPKVYGKKLELSTLAVLISMIAGGMAAGVIGAVASLPLVAAYPALERLWLPGELEPEVIHDHQEQLHAA